MSQGQPVTFTSDGLELAGELRLPDDDGPRPGVVLTGPLTGVKEQVTGTYAQRLAERGYATLALDHRNFGESEGEPRQHEDSAGKLNDLRDAVSFLRARAEVDPDRVGMCGICLGTAYALKAAAFDPRVKALALVAGAYNDPRAMREGMGAEGYTEQLRTAAEAWERYAASGELDYMPAVAADGGPAVMAGDEPFAYYGTDRAHSPGWENRVTVLSIRELITLDAAMGAEFISPTPMLVVHGERDDYCSPDGARAVYERAGEPKRLVWLPAELHIDLYDNDDFVGPAVDEVVRWFDQHLA
ncbi:MAG TPA: alpha/beta hydrolase [Egibacteraceae bacterium]|nr:alpha/beta hydrolase [Egibacteraceae bacterium]